ncbi:glutathione hydrolase 5 proenzyme [Eublepharis macularius]|uniref:Glutathione hydrolase 5 proenzyme n=1 Tax=Eublepharis macularius TaxID=481883 RepID=A0AA97LEP5_EUBMA|nr:glutathione hydrolase 5 proenzyme [Eublepharis macularius]
MASTKRRGCYCLAAVLSLAVVAALLAVLLTRPWCVPPRYPHAAVAADTRTCSDVGRNILQRGGSAVDAAIAALICTSVLNPQSMGLGGGAIFTIYNASTGKVEVINARERAPQAISGDLLDQCQPLFLPGAQWIAVPGELRGYEEAHKRYGKLPWKTLFKPTIKILESGVKIPKVLSLFLKEPILLPSLKTSSLSKLFFDEGNILGEGQTLYWPALIETLKAVAENGADEFYTGKTAEKLVEDMRKEGGILTLDDLKNYQVEVVKPLNISLEEYTVYSAPRPAAGPILFFILNILKGFNFTKATMNTLNEKAEAYHYIAETLKFANGQKTKVEDPAFSLIKEDAISELVSDSFANRVRAQIDERGDHAATHYNLTQPGRVGLGTSHVSVLAEDGSAVSVTSTINQPFGSMVYSESTGIILNNELADFCMKKSNKEISPGEMPPSSMAPAILISSNGQSKLVIGGSGGTLITPAVALVIANKLLFKYSLDDAIKASILFPDENNSIKVEQHFDKDILKRLQEKGHKISVANRSLNVVQGISKEGHCTFAYSDLRKQGEASGY